MDSQIPERKPHTVTGYRGIAAVDYGKQSQAENVTEEYSECKKIIN